MNSDSYKKLGGILLSALLIYFFLRPEALSKEAWLLFTVFVSTIVGIVLKPLPMGALSLIAITFLATTKTIPLQTVLKGFSNDLIWLILLACFLAKGLIHTGLGRRIAFWFLNLFGGSPLGMSYGLLVSSTCIAPIIPSATARTGGILLPVLESLIEVSGAKRAGNHIGALLTMTVFHGSIITSATFITANAGNPIIVKFAKDVGGIDISWGTWTLAALIPSLLSLIFMPLLLSKILPPCTSHDVKRAEEHAKEELKKMGPVSVKEKIALSCFGLLLFLWSCGSYFGVQTTEAALIGVTLLIITGIITWKDVLSEELAWDTFIWLSILVMMATELQNLGVVQYFTGHITALMPTSSWLATTAILTLIYFYSHYLFASTNAHLGSMYGPFLAVALSVGAPPLFAALLLGYTSSLFGGLTHYSSGPAPILYSQGHVEVKTWWKVGAITSLFYIVVWLVVGPLWWKVLGLF